MFKVEILLEDQIVKAYFLSSFLSEYGEFFFGAANSGSSKQKISEVIIICEEKINCHCIQSLELQNNNK
jgi:hypothetical protein